MRRELTRSKGNDALRARLHEFSRKHKRWGYRKAAAILRDEGWDANRKRIQRLWREEGLKVPTRKRKRRRLGSTTCPADRLRAERPNHVWALDFQFDQTSDGRILKLLNIVDEHSREELGGLVERRIDADRTVSVLEGIVTNRGRSPELIRCDNGPELTANALRDWCRFSGTGTSYIEPGSPWENPFVESFGSRMRDEVLSTEQSTPCSKHRSCSGTGSTSTTTTGPITDLAGSPGRIRYGLEGREPSGPTLITGGPRTGVPSVPLGWAQKYEAGARLEY